MSTVASSSLLPYTESNSSSSLNCYICSEIILPQAAIWVCNRQCFSIFHLNCIQQHASNVKSGVSKLLRNVLNQYLPTWNCPACPCTYPEEAYPNVYTCFCGRTINPEYNPYLPPHSCGLICGRKFENCNHTCNALCHSGKCESCISTVEVPCYCGKEKLRKRCGQAATSCNSKCERTGISRYSYPVVPSDLPDEYKYLQYCTHKCSATCHDGSCPPCPFPVMNVECVCGASKKTLPCFKRIWKCDKVCNQLLPCGKHYCTSVCHKQGTPCSPCPGSNRATCPCGRSVYSDLPCTATPPSCPYICDKLHDCGIHRCQRICHDGSCGPCPEQIETLCNCGRKSKIKLCSGEKFYCDTRCTVPRNCHRHVCRKRCCKGLGPNPVYLKDENTYSFPNTTLVPPTSNMDEDNTEYCPPCREICGLKRSCGNCIDESFCHSSSNCLPCTKLVTVSFCEHTFVRVPCGQEKNILPPVCIVRCNKSSCSNHPNNPVNHSCHPDSVPCPPCTLKCSKLLPCNHPCMANCHGNTPCPPCIVSVDRSCIGDHEMRSVTCSSPSLFKCNSLCKNSLDCTKHFCQRSCHMKLEQSKKHHGKSTTEGIFTKGTGCGANEDGQCNELCSESRKCLHPCLTLPNNRCHPGICKPCEVKITKSCYCGQDTKSWTCAVYQLLAKKEQENSYSCQRACPNFFKCGHACTLVCHAAGKCDDYASCEKLTTVRCKCGKGKEQWLCTQISDKRKQLGISPFDTSKNLVLLLCTPELCTTLPSLSPVVNIKNAPTNEQPLPSSSPTVETEKPSTLRHRGTEKTNPTKKSHTESTSKADLQKHSTNAYIYYAIGIIIFIMVLYIFYKLLRLSLK